ncbi:sigma-70 family RNA polymerase sigma factor [Massilia sp. BJB1822]|uniref:sigma-70 family RNA polymerase sigma factor n=1 Tax=Massilia sp. BJB1822 TaxID=2744470 RepID=UPI001592BA43|nr:sigma-70 family RNA polymerase sigma factor [Massilia sp. BJB1822]NVE01850.1 sigma-70 family RNA polymerase sigma factor [Massilia sp. BJB1822]
MPAAIDQQRQHADLWQAFHASGDAAARERLAGCYLDFARIMAGKLYAGRSFAGLEFDDYLQFARLGLLEAIDRYDISHGVKFETYAAPRINGAILSGIQSYSEVQEQVAARKQIVAQRVGALRQPAPDGRDPEALFGYLAEVAIGLALGFALEGQGIYSAGEQGYPDNTYAGIELRQLRQRMVELVQQLPARQRRVIAGHYLQGQPFEEIAAALQLSKGRVAQLHKEGLHTLRERIRRGAAREWSF